jgi:hypothetical protein
MPPPAAAAVVLLPQLRRGQRLPRCLLHVGVPPAAHWIARGPGHAHPHEGPLLLLLLLLLFLLLLLLFDQRQQYCRRESAGSCRQAHAS